MDDLNKQIQMQKLPEDINGAISDWFHQYQADLSQSMRAGVRFRTIFHNPFSLYVSPNPDRSNSELKGKFTCTASGMHIIITRDAKRRSNWFDYRVADYTLEYCDPEMFNKLKLTISRVYNGE